MKVSVTLFLMTQKGFRVVESLAAEYLKCISAVVSSRDSKVQKDYYDEIKQICKERDVRFYDRKENPVVDSLYAFAISWRWLLSPLSSRLIVFHDSLLPRYRGFNPLVSALINEDEQIGVTACFAATKREYDRGDIIAQSRSRISYPIKIQEAIDVVAGNYVELVNRILEALNQGEVLQSTRQDESEATYSLWRDDEDYRIEWSQSAAYIKRFIDAVGFPYQGALTLVDGIKARVMDAEVVEDVNIVNRVPGKVIFFEDSLPIVVCGQGLLKIKNLVADGYDKSLLPLPRFRMRFK